MYNNYNDDYESGPYPYRRSNPMATASVVLGIVSIFLCPIFYFALPCAAIAIICAVLSRGNGRIAGRSRAGIICGTAGIVLSLVLTVTSFYVVLRTDEGRSILQYYYEYYTGDTQTDINAVLNDMFPFLGGSTGESDEAATESTDETPAGNDSNDADDEGRTGPRERQPNERQPDDSSPDHSDGEGVQYI